MTDTTQLGIAITGVFTAALLASEHRGSTLGRALTKPVASLGFIVAAFGHGALDTPHGRLVFAGLLLSALGDVALIPADPRAFLGGLGSFLLGHLAFAAAFLVRGVTWQPALVALPAVVVFSGVVWRWLSPHVEGPLRGPVLAYLTVISAMMVLAVGTYALRADLALLAGAVAFAVSDISVARDRFVTEGLPNKLWGLPMYYAAQLLIGSAVG